MKWLVPTFMALYYPAVLALTAWIWITTKSPWSLFLLLGLFPSFHYKEDDDKTETLVKEMMRAINVLRMPPHLVRQYSGTDSPSTYARDILIEALRKAGFELEGAEDERQE